MSKPKPKLWFKVLVNGKSCHGGNFKWSLPKAGKPGRWHTIPKKEQLHICETGFHLTNDPKKWRVDNWKIYVAEFEGEATEQREDKIAVRKVRLLRKASAAELLAVGIITEGSHKVKEGEYLACGSSEVTAYGSSEVTACDSSKVTACGSSKVTAYGSSEVTAKDSSKVTAYDSSKVTAKDKVTIDKQSFKAKISLLGLAVELDWTSGRAEFRRAE